LRDENIERKKEEKKKNVANEEQEGHLHINGKTY
jgi:hypothetical protein